MLDAIRKRSGSIFVKLLMVLLILSFGLWGVNDVFFAQAQRQTVIVVGDSEIVGAELEQAVSREVTRLQRMVGQIDITQAKALGVVDSVVDQLVTRNLYAQAARDLGLVVGEPLLRDAIAENPAFRGALGTFDSFTFQQALQSNGLNEEIYVSQLRSDIIRGQLLSSITAGVSAPETLTEAVYRYANERRVAETLLIRDADMDTPADPGDEALKAFHEANAPLFTAPETRGVTAVVLSADDVAQEIAVSDAELSDAYENRRHLYSNPEVRHIRQMVLPGKEEAEKARAELDRGRDFADVAKELTGADAASLDLGEMKRDDMLPEMAEAAFALDKDAASQPVESPLGWHIIQVTDIKPGSEPTLDDIRDRLAAELAREKAIDSLYDLSNKVEDSLGGGATLEEAAQQINLPLVKIDSVDATGRNAAGEAVADLPPIPRFLDVVFQTPEGEESALEEGGTDSYFVVRVDKITPPALRPFDDVRADVLAAWQAEERKAAADTRASALLNRLAGGTDLATLAAEAGLTLETTQAMRRTADGADVPQALRDMIFAGDEGAYTIARGPNGHYIARVKEVIKADPAAQRTSAEAVSQRLAAGMRDDVARQFAAALREKYDVTINSNVIDELF